MGVPAIMFSHRVKHYHHWLPVRSGLNNQLLVQQVSSELLFLSSIIYILNFGFVVNCVQEFNLVLLESILDKEHLASFSELQYVPL